VTERIFQYSRCPLRPGAVEEVECNEIVSHNLEQDDEALVQCLLAEWHHHENISNSCRRTSKMLLQIQYVYLSQRCTKDSRIHAQYRSVTTDCRYPLTSSSSL